MNLKFSSQEWVSPKENELTEEQVREHTRSSIALLFLWGYLVLLVLLILFATFASLSMDAVKDFLLALGGPFGFVIGFYFKSESEI